MFHTVSELTLLIGFFSTSQKSSHNPRSIMQRTWTPTKVHLPNKTHF